MNVKGCYAIDNKEFELYQAASGDYCVSVYTYCPEGDKKFSTFEGREDYNLGSLEKAYAFILGYAEMEED